MSPFTAVFVLSISNFALGSASNVISKDRLNRYCHAVTSTSDSYCMTHKNPPVCHGSSTSCSQAAVLGWEDSESDASLFHPVMTTPQPSVTLKQQDDYCRTLVGKSSYCKVTAKSCVCQGAGSKDCSVSTVTAYQLASTSPPTTTLLPQLPPNDLLSIFGFGSSTDPCEFARAVLLGRSPTSGDNYYTTIASLRACMMSTKISHGSAIWTLHNLNFGVAETYSFTDLVTDTLVSEHANVCGHTVHAVEVDLVREIVGQIAEYNAILSSKTPDEIDKYLLQERPAYAFHSSLLNLMNRLHDAHTLYTTPFDMFRVYLPISFGSEMRNGRQVITLRMSLDPTTPLGRLAHAYHQVYGVVLPIPPSYANSVVTHINGIDALAYLKSLTFGPLAASYQQAEQRLNAFVFSTPLLAFSQVLSTLPDLDSMHLRFETTEVEIKYLGQFSDLSTSPYYKVPSLRSTAALSTYMHSNEAFTAFMKYEGQTAKQETLWKYAAAVHGSQLTSSNLAAIWRSLSRKHRALLDPVANLRRDNLLNVVGETGEEVFVDASVLGQIIRNTLQVSESAFVHLSGGLSYYMLNDTVVVRIPSMAPEPRFADDADFYFFPDFVTIQAEAKSRKVTRLLFDLTGNGGGYVISAYALMWYVMADRKQICAPLRKRITPNWKLWIESFGDGLGPMVEKYLRPKGDALADEINVIFAEISSIVNLIFDGLGLPMDIIGQTTKEGALARVNGAKISIMSRSKKSDQAAAIMKYLKEAKFLPPEMLKHFSNVPFDPTELSEIGGQDFVPVLKNYKFPTLKNWGKRPANYSLPGEYKFCRDVTATMRRFAYDRTYWTQTAFVSDGTCGSACALFAQGVQLSGSAVAFTYGGLADTAMDVGSFAGGNVEEYSEFWPQLALAARIGQLVSRGQSPWSLAHANSWVASPIAFPTRAGARFNWNMVFSPAMGPDALPRQLYLVPPRRHINRWAASEAEMLLVYRDIVQMPDWHAEVPQFAHTHGQCPSEQ